MDKGRELRSISASGGGQVSIQGVSTPKRWLCGKCNHPLPEAKGADRTIRCTQCGATNNAAPRV